MKRNNPAKEKFIHSLPPIAIEDHVEGFKNKICFSFKYFDNAQDAGQDFRDWSQEQLEKLLTKLKHYSDNTMKYWMNQRVGAGSLKILEVYGNFPKNSEFVHPKHVPIDVLWARFRLESDMRLVGFVLPECILKEKEIATNIFYIVFLDQNHRFYLTEDN